MGEIPYGPQIGHEEAYSQNALEGGKVLQPGNALEPVPQMKKVNVQGKQKNSQNGESQYQAMVIHCRGAFRLLLLSYAIDETLETDSTECGEHHPSAKQHNQGVEQGIFGGGLLIADVKDEQNNDEIDDVVKHLNFTHSNGLDSFYTAIIRNLCFLLRGIH